MTVAKTLVRTSKRMAKAALRPLLGGSPSSVVAPSPEHWGLTRMPSGALALNGIALPALRSWGSPLHIVDAARLRHNARRFLAVPAGAEAGCEVFYSYKTNPVPGVLTELHALGLGAEVISHYEFWLARRLGVPPDRIVFNGPAKSEASIRDAIEQDIQILNINHREEIAVVARVAEALGRKPRVGLRITVGDGWTGQFGIPVANGQALAAYREALASPHLHVVGVHAHRGGMIRGRDELVSFASSVLAFVDQLHQHLGLHLEIVNFGGSLGTPTVIGLSSRELRLSRTFRRELTPPEPQAALGIDDYIATLVRSVEAFFGARRRPRPRVFIEPGRAVTSDAQMLLASVLTTKAEADRTFVVLDAGINLAESCRSEYHRLLSATHADQADTRIYTIVGPICTPGDTLYWAARVPPLAPGDAVVIMDAGAYFVPFATSFSFPRPPIVLIDGQEVRLLRRGETFDDLIAHDQQQSAISAQVSPREHADIR
jgi:diaminopimelate decarboxylase